MPSNIMYQILHYEKSKLMADNAFLNFLSDHLRYYVKTDSTQVLKLSTLFIVSIFQQWLNSVNSESLRNSEV